ncbi:MAG: ABC transporter permease [Marinifilaceae bacterium]
MLLNNLKIAFRNLLRNKTYSFINISGLAIGMACTILLLMWVDHETSYDSFHTDTNHLYQVGTILNFNGKEANAPNLPGMLIDALKEKIPEFQYITNYDDFGQKRLLEFAGKKQYQTINHADPDFLKMFDFPLLKGNMETALNDPYSIVLTEKGAKKIFGSEDPMGKLIRMDNKHELKVTGLLKNPPSNTTFDFDYLMPFEFLKKESDFWKHWGTIMYYGYAQISKNSNSEVVNEKLRHFYQDHVDKEMKNKLFIFPLRKTHLYDLDGQETKMQNVRLFLIIALFILLIACFNFMNLSTARASKRAKEIGLKKAIGAHKGNLIRQFLGESILVSFIAINFALILVRLFLPEFNNLLQEQLHLNYTDWRFLSGLVSVILVTGLLAGAYPAFYLTAFKPVLVLKGILQKGKKGNLFRKILVVLQFSISIILLISTLVVGLQIHHMKNKDLGLNKDNIVYIPLTGEMAKKSEIIKREITAEPTVENVTFSSHIPNQVYRNGWGLDWEGKDPQVNPMVTFLTVDGDYHHTFKLKLIDGKFFKKEATSVDSNSVVINEKFAKIISKESVVGKIIKDDGFDLKIIGVVKDFNFTHINRKIGPLMMDIASGHNYLFARIHPENTQRAIDHIRKVCSQYNPEFPVENYFLDDKYSAMYRSQESTMSILNYFSILAIIISCLGLFGLTSFMAEERTKEIGVRKVLGASVIKLVGIFSREFTKWVLLSNLIAWPISWYLLKEWLQNFAYRIDMPIWVFAAVALLVLLIAFATVGYQSLKSATRNPIESLKYE